MIEKNDKEAGNYVVSEAFSSGLLLARNLRHEDQGKIRSNPKQLTQLMPVEASAQCYNLIRHHKDTSSYFSVKEKRGADIL
jgi:hypothetical protein